MSLKERPQPSAPPEEPELRDDVHVQSSRSRCPFCHDEVAREAEWTACAGCLARHHASCWTESGVCASCGTEHALEGPRQRQPGQPLLRIALAVGLLGLVALVVQLAHLRTELARSADQAQQQTAQAEALAKEVSQQRALLQKALQEPQAPVERYLGATPELTALHDRALAGEVEAMATLAVALKKGEGVSPNREAADEWLQKAADSGHAESAHQLGLALGRKSRDTEDRAETSRLKEQALFWLERAVDLGSVDALESLASNRWSAWKRERALTLYAQYLAKAESPSIYDRLTYAQWLDEASQLPRAEVDKEVAARRNAVFSELEEAGQTDPEALARLGEILLEGNYGVPKDAERGRAHLMKAAKQLDPRAINILSHRLDRKNPERVAVLELGTQIPNLHTRRHYARELFRHWSWEGEHAKAADAARRAWSLGAASDRKELQEFLEKHPELRQDGDPPPREK